LKDGGSRRRCGSSARPPKREVRPEQLFEKLKPFKDLVEHDIEDEER
jgi:hypothetical protein